MSKLSAWAILFGCVAMTTNMAEADDDFFETRILPLLESSTRYVLTA